uniref:SfiI-subtelomeric related protein family member n=1 Tax=Theileria annulata TaxID=5874 RepID=A0A3B0MZX1_THEAN
MWLKYMSFLVLFVGLVLGQPERFALDLFDINDSRYVAEKTRFDNVSYGVFKPQKEKLVTEVLFGQEKVWRSSCDQETAQLVLLATKVGEPFLLYVKSELAGPKHYYYYFEDYTWVKTNFEHYLDLLNKHKSDVETKEFTLNLGLTHSSEKVNFSGTTNFKKFDSFFVDNSLVDEWKTEFAATKVVHDVTPLWFAKKEGERAVAGWAYKSGKEHYLVRVLVRNSDFKFRFFNFLKVGNSWTNLELGPFKFLKSDDKVFPEDFYYPEYLNNEPSPTHFMTDSSVSLTNLDDFVDESFEYKPESRPEDYDFKHFNAPIPFTKLHRLDFSKRVPGSVATNVTGLFDNKVTVQSYYPTFGNFFGVVRDGKHVIFERNLDVEACVGVHFYNKDKQRFLADVLVYSPHNPRSEYHVKRNGRWSPVSKGVFTNLMNQL